MAGVLYFFHPSILQRALYGWKNEDNTGWVSCGCEVHISPEGLPIDESMSHSRGNFHGWHDCLAMKDHRVKQAMSGLGSGWSTAAERLDVGQHIVPHHVTKQEPEPVGCTTDSTTGQTSGINTGKLGPMLLLSFVRGHNN
jgi:hypothetical protein